MIIKETTSVNSIAEDLFVQLFCETFGPENADKLFIQYPVLDIYGRHRYIDFALKDEEKQIAIEIDGETYHNPAKVSESKYSDDLLKQNSLVYQDWKVYRWAYSQLKQQPEKIKDEMVIFLGETPFLKEFDDYLPTQRGEIIELRDYQKDALKSLKEIRASSKTIAMLYHATGVGKTVTAAADAKTVGGRTLFLVNKIHLAEQAEKTFAKVWPEASLGQFTGESKNYDTDVVFATVQSMAGHYKEFDEDAFSYICVDECHHAAAETYKRLFGYFKSDFILGLTATPERADGEDMLELFQNVAHKMELKTAVNDEILASIRCLRIKTDIDLSDVRINNIRYNSIDLESKLFIPERNQLISDTYYKLVKDKKTVIFCASVEHADLIADLIRQGGERVEAITGRDSKSRRKKVLEEYECGDINVLCACDLLNEGWDSPHTEVLFMARPTMSKTIYMQQLGRGTRKCEGKDELLVIDFVDNANQFNMPYSLHRVLNIGKYKPYELVLASKRKKQLDYDMIYKGERPDALLDIPIDINDIEVIDLFNWHEVTKEMISQLEFVRMVDVQSETIARYITDGKIVSDMSVPIGENKKFHYFNRETVEKYAKEFGWDIITDTNMKEKFLEYVEKMDMSFSYKPVLLMAIYEYIDEQGQILIEDIVEFFIDYYEHRRNRGLVIEKKQCLFLRDYSKKEVEKNIFSNPFKRFADMRFLSRCKSIELIQINPVLFKKLQKEDWDKIVEICKKSLKNYFND